MRLGKGPIYDRGWAQPGAKVTTQSEQGPQPCLRPVIGLSLGLESGLSVWWGKSVELTDPLNMSSISLVPQIINRNERL